MNGMKHTLVDAERTFIDADVECEWVVLVAVVSMGGTAAAVDAVLDAFVTWSAGIDSVTVCSVDRIVVDMISWRFVRSLPLDSVVYAIALTMSIS